MKNILKKKVNIFGKGIPVFVIALFGIALVSAALVGYLSNTVQAEIEVKSPMVVGISEGKDSWIGVSCWRVDETRWVNSFPECKLEEITQLAIHDWDETDWKETLTLEDMYTGQDKTFTLYTMSHNEADTEVIGHEEIRVANPDGVTCEDFEIITSRFDSIYGDRGYGSLHTDVPSPNCHNVYDNPNLIEIWSADDSSKWGSGETDVAKWTITFNNVKGKYTFTYRVIPTA